MGRVPSYLIPFPSIRKDGRNHCGCASYENFRSLTLDFFLTWDERCYPYIHPLLGIKGQVLVLLAALTALPVRSHTDRRGAQASRHKRALVLTARKLVRLVFALLTKKQLYDPSLPAKRRWAYTHSFVFKEQSPYLGFRSFETLSWFPHETCH